MPPLDPQLVNQVIDAAIDAGISPEDFAAELQDVPEEEATNRILELAGQFGLEVKPPLFPGVAEERARLVRPGPPGAVEPPGALAAVATGIQTGITFGAAKLLPGQRAEFEKAREEFPLPTIAGELIGGLTPFSLPRTAARIPQFLLSVPKIIKASKNAKALRQISSEIPGAGRVALSELLESTRQAPGLVSEALAATALIKAETGSTTAALIAGGATGSLGALFKLLGIASEGAIRASFADPQVRELIQFSRTNPTRFKQIVKDAVRGDADILRRSIKVAARINKAVRLKKAGHKNLTIRLTNEWMRRAKKVINQDFGQATKRFVAENGDQAIDVTRLSNQFDTIIETAKGQIDPEDLTFLSEMREALGAITVDQPNTLPLSRLLELRKTVQGESKFTKMASADNVFARQMFNATRQTLRKQSPGYATILDNYAGTIEPFKRIQGKIRIRGVAAPGKRLDTIFGSIEEEEDLMSAFDEFLKNAKGNRNSVTLALKAGMENQRLALQEGALFKELLEDFPKNPKQLRTLFLRSGMDELDNPAFVDFVSNNPVMKQAREEVRAFKIAENIFGSMDGILDEMVNLAIRTKIGISGISRGGFLKRIAAESPDIATALNSIRDTFQDLTGPGKKIVTQFLKGLIPASGDITQILVEAAINETFRPELERRFEMSNEFFTARNEDTERASEELREKFALEEVRKGQPQIPRSEIGGL